MTPGHRTRAPGAAMLAIAALLATAASRGAEPPSAAAQAIAPAAVAESGGATP